ncbi:MAG: hypothetical protein OEU25_21940, partial [Rhodospirillales bacterium]|nr:hypothetical protein [Rhodospirillales bacterium]
AVVRRPACRLLFFMSAASRCAALSHMPCYAKGAAPSRGEMPALAQEKKTGVRYLFCRIFLLYKYIKILYFPYNKGS